MKIFDYKFWRGVMTAFIVVFTVILFLSIMAFDYEGDINRFLKVEVPTTEITADTNYFPSDYNSKDELAVAIKAHNLRTHELFGRI